MRTHFGMSFCISQLFLIMVFGGCEKSVTLRYSGGPVAPSQQSIARSSEHQGTFEYPQAYFYEYYPTSNVYFDAKRNLYFYTNGEEWYKSSTLPAEIALDRKEVVTLQSANDRPFLSDAP